MKSKHDPEKRTRDVRDMALDHFNDSEELREVGEFESAEYELAKAEEYREMYQLRTKS